MKSKPLIFATSNQGKIAEIKAIFPNAEFLPLPIDCTEPQPQGLKLSDAIEVALLKAKNAFTLLKKCVIVEDTALFIESLNGFPGSLVKFSTETLSAREALCRSIPANASRAAHAHCILAWHDGTNDHHVIGTISGAISFAPESKAGEDPFGWDDIFIPSGESKTFFKLPSSYKLKNSMRTKALNKLKD